MAATKTVSVVTGGSNQATVNALEINYPVTDFVSDGVVAAVGNTAGVAPTTGGFAVNAQGTPNMTVRVSAGALYKQATPLGGSLQGIRVLMNTFEDVTIAANATGGTRYDFLYLAIDQTKLANPGVNKDDVATLVTSRSTLATSDNGTGVTVGVGLLLAVITVTNGAVSIVNSNIADSRLQAGPTPVVTLGFAQVTTPIITTSTTYVQAAGLTATVQVPAGRRIKITAFGGAFAPGAGFSQCSLSIWDGVVGSGTQIAEMINNASTSAGSVIPAIMMAVVTPGSTQKTYNVGIKTASTQATLTASATSPAFLIVEAI